MDRKLLITIHMYLAAFFAPAVLLVAISGGLYLFGVKGEVKETLIHKSEVSIDSSSSNLKDDVDALLKAAGVDAFSFDYVKISGEDLYTRPTSTSHYIVKKGAAGADVIFAQPSLQRRMIELHKGHGPTVFKTFQKVFAAGLIFIMLSGLWLGLAAARLRRNTLITVVFGVLVFAGMLF